MFDDSLLDDPVRLADADTGGLLRAAAMAGAQVRSTAEAAADADLVTWLEGTRPRAIVLVGRHGIGGTVAGMLAALVSADSPVPVVVSDGIPPWVGALDVVYAHVDDAGDMDLAGALERAARYGARVVLSGPDEGPVAAAVAGKGVVLTPRIPGVEHVFAATMTAGLLTIAALGLLTVDADELADQLDAEAERDHLGHESFVNPAKALAVRMADRTPLLWGTDPVAAAVATHAAHALAGTAAVVADAADYRKAVARPALHRAAVASTNGADIFADPDDPHTPAGLLRLMLLTVRQDRCSEVVRRTVDDVFQSADVVDIAEMVDGGEVVRAAVLVLRFEMAAIYLGLATGTIGGDRFTPVGA